MCWLCAKSVSGYNGFVPTVGYGLDAMGVDSDTTGFQTYSDDLAFNGSGDAVVSVAASTASTSTGQHIDGLLRNVRWSDGAITYSFPDAAGDYQAGYSSDQDADGFSAQNEGFSAFGANQRRAAETALNEDVVGTQLAGAQGNAVEAFTNLSISGAGVGSGAGTIRYANTSDAATAYAFYPSAAVTGGDGWFGPGSGTNAADEGNYHWATILHETGHSLGLKHGHDTSVYGAVPASQDSLEFTVMTYRSFVGDDTAGYNNETWGYPQTYMTFDIAALQYMYGADFTTSWANAGNTAYWWDPASGNAWVHDGTNWELAIAPGANRVFQTIWDGNGNDTYDFSAYTTGVTVDLRPGQHSITSTAQLADLNGGAAGGLARGNVWNALLYNGDLRSLIENAAGGSGNDQFTLYDYNRNNWIDGNGGTDYVYLSYNYGAGYTVESGGTASNLTLVGSQGTDLFHEIEWFNFNGSWVSSSNLAVSALTAYNFWWWDPDGSGDFYYGTVYDNGTYGYQVGQTWNGPYTTGEYGENGYYYIWGSQAATGTHSAGEVRTYDFYDYQAGFTLNTYNENNGYVSGSSGLGSENDWIVNSSGHYDHFGQDWFSSNYYPTAYNFYWWDQYGSGDFYYGTVYDDGSYGYDVGQYWSGPYSNTQASGNNAYYFIYGQNEYAGAGHYTGEIRTYDYYDAQSGYFLNTYNENNGYVSGWSGFGSEYDWIQNAYGGYDDFGVDWYQANYF